MNGAAAPSYVASGLAASGLAASGVAAASVGGGVVGPNAVTQVAAALRAAEGEVGAQMVFASAGLAPPPATPPTEMVDERIAAAVHQAVRAALPPTRAEAVLRDAGARTADYVVANRIPPAVRVALRLSPARVATGLLLRAIARHGWTFVGSGSLSVRPGRPAWLEIKANPLAGGPCWWHAAAFEQMFRRLAASRAQVSETACAAAGAAACRFEISY